MADNRDWPDIPYPRHRLIPLQAITRHSQVIAGSPKLSNRPVHGRSHYPLMHRFVGLGKNTQFSWLRCGCGVILHHARILGECTMPRQSISEDVSKVLISHQRVRPNS
jgi:hypothetical protein